MDVTSQAFARLVPAISLQPGEEPEEFEFQASSIERCSDEVLPVPGSLQRYSQKLLPLDITKLLDPTVHEAVHEALQSEVPSLSEALRPLAVAQEQEPPERDPKTTEIAEIAEIAEDTPSQISSRPSSWSLGTEEVGQIREAPDRAVKSSRVIGSGAPCPGQFDGFQEAGSLDD